MSKSMAIVAVLGAMLLVMALTGCSDEPDPTPTPTPTSTSTPAPASTPAPEVKSTPTATPTPEVTSTPTVTPAPEASPTPASTPAPEASPTPVVVVPTETPEPIEHGNARAIATELEVGASVAGAVDYEDDVDYFRFTAQAGQLYQIDVALDTLDDSYLELRDADDWYLADNDDFGDSLASRIVWAAPESGDVYVVVSAGWESGTGTGSYTLTVALSDIADDHGNSFGDATGIQVGQASAGAVDYEGDVDYFRFTAQAGQLYQIDVALDTLDDSYLELRDADDWYLADNDDFGDSLASRIVWAAPESGDVYVVVSAGWGSGTGTGSYTLTVALSDIADDHGNSFGDATGIQVGQASAGAVDYEGDVDYFRFTAQAGQLYQIDVALDTLDDSYLGLLRDADDWYLAGNDDFGDSLASRIVWAAPESGDVYVVVSAGWESGTGSYTLTVALSDIVDDHGNSFGDATGIQVGQASAGAVDYEGDVDYFRFTVQAGQLYQIDVALDTLDDSYLELRRDADDWELAYNDDFGDSLASRIVWAAPESGDVYVVVSGFDGEGSYTLTVTLSDIVDDHGNYTGSATGIQVGQATAGAVDYEGDVDYFRFTAQADQIYQIDVALDTLDDSYLELRRDADDWYLADNDDFGDSLASRIVWTAPESGDVYVVVSGFDGEGSYTLTITVQ